MSQAMTTAISFISESHRRYSAPLNRRTRSGSEFNEECTVASSVLLDVLVVLIVANQSLSKIVGANW